MLNSLAATYHVCKYTSQSIENKPESAQHAVRAETLGMGFRDSVTDMQGHAASLSHRARSHFPGIMGMDERRNDGGMKRGLKGVVCCAAVRRA